MQHVGGCHFHSHSQLLTACSPCSALRQIAVGFVLATLLVWRAQLRTACQWATAQPAGPQREAAERQLRASQYAWLCAPVMEAAGTLGFGVITLVAAVLGFAAALVARQEDLFGSGSRSAAMLAARDGASAPG